MNVVKLNDGDKYRFVVHNPKSERCGEWIDGDVLFANIIYGYEIDRNSYVIHNEKGPAIIWSEFNSKTYALHGRIYEYDDWIKKLRKYKIKKVCLDMVNV